MTSLDQRRRERARNGSQRKRDLAAAATKKPDWDAFVAEHFPNELYGNARAATEKLWMAKPPRDRALPDPDRVRDYMRSRGWLREQLEGDPCL